MISSTKDYEQEVVTYCCICGVLFLWTSKGSKTEEFLSNDFITIIIHHLWLLCLTDEFLWSFVKLVYLQCCNLETKGLREIPVHCLSGGLKTYLIYILVARLKYSTYKKIIVFPTILLCD